MDEKIILTHVFPKAIIGTTNDSKIAYDYLKMIESLMEEQGWDETEAMLWIEVNWYTCLSKVDGNEYIIIYPVEKDENKGV